MAVDAHLHLDQYAPAERDDMLRRAAAAGVVAVVAVSTDPDSCRLTEELARRYPGFVLPAYGHHPEQPPLSDRELDALCDWIRSRTGPFAIGEVGLPTFLRLEAARAGRPFDLSPYVRQLERFVWLAQELDRPLALHAVQEEADVVLDMLERVGVRRAHFHWYKGAARTTERLIRGGYRVSVTPEALYEEESRRLAAAYPLHLLMAETDGPWPYEGPFAGRRTEPAMAADVVREIAALRGMNAEVVDVLLDRRTLAFYGFPEGG